MRGSAFVSMAVAAAAALLCESALWAQTTTGLSLDSAANNSSATVTGNAAATTVTTTNVPGAHYSSLAWSRFNVGAGSTVHFAQPQLPGGPISVSINRVIDSNPSTIAGTLTSNGRIILVNPYGITVSAGALVDTAGFTASTVNATDSELLAAGFGTRRDLTGPGMPVDIQGRITARAGDVVLVGSQLSLRGSIDAMGTALEGGRVVLRSLDTLQVGGQVLARQGTATQGGQIEILGAQVTLESSTALRAGSIAITAEGTAPTVAFQEAEVMADQGALTVTADQATLDGVNRLWGSAGTTFSSAVLPGGIAVTLGAGSTLQTTGLSASGVARPGTLTLHGGLTVGRGATLRMAAGSGDNDRVVIRGGSADFADASTNTVELSLLPGSDTLKAGSYTLIEGRTSQGLQIPTLTGAKLPKNTSLAWGSLVLKVPAADVEDKKYLSDLNDGGDDGEDEEPDKPLGPLDEDPDC